jgi:hypothetical protein
MKVQRGDVVLTRVPHAAGGRGTKRSAVVRGAGIMAITVEAVYENGMLKPQEPLPLTEHERVHITI